MNRINILFQNKPSNILNIYYTAGYPNLNDTFEILKALQASGVDMVEIGIPYSDPIADGETIQNSSQKALDNGMTLHLLLEQLKDIRKNGITLPILLMGYINPIIQYGEEAFLNQCQQIGIDGLIIPDMPIEVYQTQYQSLFEKYGILNTFLITPQTTLDRIQQIDQISTGFIYMVSSAGTTGAKSEISNFQEDYFLRINNLNLKNSKLIGFGISNKSTFQKANQFAQGAIIGSAFVNLLAISKNFKADISTFIKSIH
jgi:tryptophan synthase alpha chain